MQNCSFTGEIIATGSYVGGIAGGGYSGSMWGVASAPNTPCANIENCYVDAKITGKDCVGGILGGEEGSTQAWGKAYVRNNCFAGQVNATDGNAGGIIGYMNCLLYTSTQKDIDLWEDCCARAIVAAGGSEEDVCQVCYGYGLFTGCLLYTS